MRGGASSEVLLEVRALSKEFGGVRAVDRVDLSLDRGEIRGLIGPNGAGKTCFLNLLSGFYPPTSGAIFYRGENISRRSPQDRPALGIGRTFQVSQLFGRMSVLENVLVGHYPEMSGGVFAAFLRHRTLKKHRETLQGKALRLLNFVGLEGLGELSAGLLPYGQQKILEVARALAHRPALLLLDEPASGLNPQEVERVKALVRQVNETGVTVLVIEHNMRLVMDLCHRITVLSSGAVIAEGKPEEVQRDERVLEAYLGRRWQHA